MAHNKVVVIPMTGDDKLATGRVAAVSPEEGHYYVISHTFSNTVLDNITGLEWEQHSSGPMAWGVLHCAFSSTANKNDWRLPTADELISIVDYKEENPAINTSAFPNTDPSYYWSVSRDARSSSRVWAVSFFNGEADSLNETDTNYVRCVR